MDYKECLRLDKTPWWDGEKMDFPLTPLRDLVFIWPMKLPEKIGSIIIPEQYRVDHRNELGLVLATGPGFYGKIKIARRKYSQERFWPIELKVGDVILYDKTTPWELDVKDKEGKKHIVKYMGEQDVLIKITD